MSLNKIKNTVLVCSMAACAVLLPGVATAAVSGSAFGDAYQPVPGVVGAQSQVVYYRLGVAGQPAPVADINVDNEFHTSLLAGAYSVFCVRPGVHGLNSVLDDAPRYQGKQSQPRFTMEGGKTYFVRVSESGAVMPEVVAREVAEKELDGSRRQAHVLSRASAVQACDNVEPQVQPPTQVYTLSSDVLFAFGRYGYGDIRDEGRSAIADIVRKLNAPGVAIHEIQVVGHTDPIGSDAANHELGYQRAQTIRQLLIDGGIAANSIAVSSRGREELVVSNCRGSRAEKIACNAPNRRVVIRVSGQN